MMSSMFTFASSYPAFLKYVVPVQLYPIIRMPGYLLLTLIFFWLYTAKVLHLKMEDFGISFSVKWWGVSLSVLLPAFVVTIFLIIGRAQVNVFSTGDIFLIIISSILIALKAGILEEILFRGFIMRLLESKWNKYIAVLVPSVLFSFAHLPSMETFTIGGVFLLIISGTLVGTMFSLASYAGNSIGNNILMHTVWNFAIEFFFCNYFTCELADHTWGSMPLFLNVTQHTEYGSQKQQATCSGREPDKKAAGPLCNTESDLLRLTGEQQILSVDLKIRF